MNPVSLRVLLVGVSNIAEQGSISIEELGSRLRASERRIRELLQELIRINLVREENGSYTCTDNSKVVVDALEDEKWDIIHQTLYDNCPEYNSVIKAITQHEGRLGPTLKEIIKISKSNNVSLNIVTSEACVEWGRRLGKIEKNLYTSGENARYYNIDSRDVDVNDFKREVLRQYQTLNMTRSRYKLIFVSIPRLREDVCEILRMQRVEFDKLLTEWYLSNPELIELAGGPLTSSARKTPTKKLSIFVDRKSLIMAPRINLEEQEGLRLRGKTYQMVVFHR